MVMFLESPLTAATWALNSFRWVFKVQVRMASFMNLISRNKTYTSSAQDRELMLPKWRFIDSKQFDPSKQEIISQSKQMQIIST